MAIDSNVFAQFGPRPKSFMDYRNEMDAAEANALALKSNQLGYQTALQNAQDEAAFRDVAKGFGANPTENLNMLRQRGLAKQASAYEKAMLESEKTRAEIEKARAQTTQANAGAQKTGLETYQAKLGTNLKILQAGTTPVAFVQMLDQGIKSNAISREEALQIVSDMPQDPAQFQQWREKQLMQTMDLTKRIEMNDRQQNNLMIPDPQNPGKYIVNKPLLAAQTQRAQAGATSISMGSPVPVQLADGSTGLVQPANRPGAAPQLMVLPGTSKPLAPAKDPNADKPLTETQGNATTFAARMRGASEVIDRMEAAGVSGADPRTMAAGNNYTNFLATPEGQQYRQAQENWVTANLRKESGAAIPKDEMDKDIAKWFPKVGDSPEVRAQKAQARKVAEEGMLVQAGPGAKQVQGILQRSAPPARPASAASGALSAAELAELQQLRSRFGKK